MRFLPQIDDPQTDGPQTDDPQTDDPQTDDPRTDQGVELVRVRVSPTWRRIDARFGSVFRRRGDPALVLG
jgi:hypothetical protein